MEDLWNVLVKGLHRLHCVMKSYIMFSLLRLLVRDIGLNTHRVMIVIVADRSAYMGYIELHACGHMKYVL